MFKRLQKKWNVNGWRLLLILITFAVGGSLTGYLGKLVMNLLGIKNAVLFVPVYIVVVTLIWPLMVLLVSILTGQFRFFTGYLKKMFARMGLGKKSAGGGRRSEEIIIKTQDSLQHANDVKHHLAIFASGAGSNAKKIIEHFRHHPTIEVSVLVCNRSGAGAMKVAAENGIPTLLIEKDKFSRDGYVAELNEHRVNFIVLAGFLWKIPDAILRSWPGRIVNIHPALLPKYGGKGFYGEHVHQSVISAGEIESGITIHFVDEHYDNGDIILQVKCPVLETDTPASLAERIHALEHANYPVVIEQLLNRS